MKPLKFQSEEFRKDLITKRVIKEKLSMQQAAEEIGISKATYSRMESGKIPDMITFIKIVNWLKTCSSWYINNSQKR